MCFTCPDKVRVPFGAASSARALVRASVAYFWICTRSWQAIIYLASEAIEACSLCSTGGLRVWLEPAILRSLHACFSVHGRLARRGWTSLYMSRTLTNYKAVIPTTHPVLRAACTIEGRLCQGEESCKLRCCRTRPDFFLSLSHSASASMRRSRLIRMEFLYLLGLCTC